MKKSTLSYLLTATVVAGTLTGATAHAFGGKAHRDCGGGASHMARDKGPGHLERLTERLDLSPEQRAEVEALFEESGDRRAELKEALRESRQTLRELTATGEASEAEIRRLAAQQAEALTELIVLRSGLRSDLRGLLTEEQREKLGRDRGRRGRRG